MPLYVLYSHQLTSDHALENRKQSRENSHLPTSEQETPFLIDT
jgi:hypothetical protein